MTVGTLSFLMEIGWRFRYPPTSTQCFRTNPFVWQTDLSYQ